MVKCILHQIKAKNVDVSDFNSKNFLRDIDVAEKRQTKGS